MTVTHEPELTFEARDEFRREPIASQLIRGSTPFLRTV
ncbi:MAG: hypothetical protein AWU56_2008 [Idiomarina sp. T82-3]|nr:MAG: hypothetical protein AWU56_2008 [Idiomarina sp. T82-3]